MVLRPASIHQRLNSIVEKPLVFFSTSWIFIHVLLLIQFGIVTNFEATKYIEQAEHLIQFGSYTSNNFIFYSIEILLIAFCLKAHIGFWFVIAIQCLANAASLFVFYKLIRQFSNSKRVAFLSTLGLIGMFYYQLYNVHLFTESLFFSFSILFTAFLFNARILNLRFFVLVICGLCLLILTRPTGLLFVPATLLYLITRFGKRNTLLLFITCFIGGLILFYFLLNTALNSGGEFDFLLPYLEEHIICGVPTILQPHQISLPYNKNSVAGLWYLISTNDELFFRLAKERLFAFWGVRRSFYSTAHNLFICIYFFSTYVLILLGLRKMFRFCLPQTLFLLTYIFLVMTTVLLSCDEWHNRFIYSILPFLLLLALGRWVARTLN